MMTSHQIVCVGPSLPASLEHLAHHRNAASLSLFYRDSFGWCSSELAELVPLPHSCDSSIRYSNRLHNFSVTFPRRYNDIYALSFFPCTARLWNSLPEECFFFDLWPKRLLSLEFIHTFFPSVLYIQLSLILIFFL